MVTAFSFTQPDGTVHIIDVLSVFPSGCDSSIIRSYGISLAEMFPDTCSYIANEANRLHHEHVTPDSDVYSDDDYIERIGIRLGQEIHRHLLCGESSGDIWREAAEHIAFRASGHRELHIYVIDDKEYC